MHLQAAVDFWHQENTAVLSDDESTLGVMIGYAAVTVTWESWRQHQEVTEGEVVAKEGNIFTPKLDKYMNVEALVIGMNGWNMNAFVLGPFKNPCVQVTECGRDCSTPLHVFNGCTSFHHYTW